MCYVILGLLNPDPPIRESAQDASYTEHGPSLGRVNRTIFFLADAACVVGMASNRGLDTGTGRLYDIIR